MENATGEKNDAAVCVNEANMSVNEELGPSSETPVKQNPKKQMRGLFLVATCQTIF